MAELSADALAIVDRLKREGDLSRNSGTNSIRSVKIELSKFQDIFKSISTNIAAQSEILKVQTDLTKEAAEKTETQEQFKEIEPQQARYEKADDEPKSKLVTESENKKINAMGDAIRSALSFKNLALAGAGLFVGYNFLKGFIDEKTGGGFTEFEKNIGPFAKSLPGIGKAMTDFPSTIGDMKTSIGKMEESITKFTTRMDSILDNLTALGVAAAVLTTLVGVNTGLRVLDNLTKPGAILNRGAGTPTTVPPGTTTTPGKAAASTTQSAPGKQPSSTQGQTTVKRTTNGSPMRISKPIEAAAAQANNSASSREKTITNAKMSKVYYKIVKGLGAMGIVLTAYQATQLVGLIDNPKSTEKDKKVAVSVFLSEMIGVVAGGTAGAIIGAFGGPWGSLILGVIGAGLGALGSGLIAEYIAKWAFEEGEPSQEDIDKKNRQIGIDQYLDKVDARPEKPMNRGTKGYGAQAKAYADWNAQYGETHNIDGTPKLSRSTGTTMGGRGNISEQPGEREAYMKAEAARQAALIEFNNPSSSLLTNTPESMVTGNTNRRNGLNTVAGNGGNGGGAVIINAPVSAPSSINLTNGGSSVNQLSISGGGGVGIGPSMLPYGLTNAYN